MMKKIGFTLFAFVVGIYIAGFIDSQVWPTGSQVPMIKKMTPSVMMKTNGKTVDYVSEDLLMGLIFTIDVIESKDPTEMNQTFHRVDWKQRRYWLNEEQYKEYRSIRRIDFLILLTNCVFSGLLLFPGVFLIKDGHKELWFLFWVELFWLAIGLLVVPDWWLIHPVWGTSAMLYFCCWGFAIAQIAPKRRCPIRVQNSEDRDAKTGLAFANEFAAFNSQPWYQHRKRRFKKRARKK